MEPTSMKNHSKMYLIWKLEIGSQKMETGNWKMEIGTHKTETGSWKMETGSWEMGCRRPGSPMEDPGTEGEEAVPGKPRRAQGQIYL